MTNQTLGSPKHVAILFLLTFSAVSCEDPYGSAWYGQPTYTEPVYKPAPAQPAFTYDIPASMYSDDAGKLATLYCLAVLNPDQLPAFVRSNRSAFQNVARLRQCTSQFKALVTQAIMRAPSRDEVYEGALKVAGSNPELQQLCGGIADDAMKTVADLWLLAGHYSDLVNSVESILLGNVEPYHQIAIYQLVKILEIGTQMFSAELRVFLFNASYPWSYALTRQACP